MNNKIFIPIIIVILIAAGAVGYFTLSKKRQNNQVENNNNNNILISNFDECVKAGYSIMESYPRQCKTPDGKTFIENIGNEIEKNDLIRASNPRPNQTIESPLTITGEARGYWYFEASFPAELVDANGKQLAIMPIMATEDWMTENFVPFNAVFNFSMPTTATGTLILHKDNPSGLPDHDDKLIIPVKFMNYNPSAREKTLFNVYFGNSSLGAECEKVAPVKREVPKTVAVGRAAIEELLKGPTHEEKQKGYVTMINSGVKINSLSIENGAAKIDFSKELDEQIGGSCRVAGISAQIRETLKQFSIVNEVVVSVDGRTKDILQP